MSKVEQQKKERINKLSKMQEKLKGVDDHLETARNDLFQIKNAVSRKQDDERTLKDEIRQVEQQIGKNTFSKWCICIKYKSFFRAWGV